MPKPKYDVPEGFKRCSRGDNCIHPMGCIQPADSEHFVRSKNNKDGLTPHCKDCHREEQKHYRAENPESVRKSNRRYHAENAERRREYSRLYYAENAEKWHEYRSSYRIENPEKVRKYNRRYRAENAEKLREYKRLYYAENAEKLRESWRHQYAKNADKVRERQHRYHIAHPEKARVHKLQRRARKHSLPDTFTSADWQRALDYFGGCCAVCGRPPGLWHTLAADHWIALSDPRPDNPGTVPTNIVPLCHGEGGCNNRKSARDPLEFLETEFGKRKAKQILARILAYFEWVKSQGGS